MACALPPLAVSGSKCLSPTLAVSGSKYLSLTVSGWVSCQTVVINIVALVTESTRLTTARTEDGAYYF